MDYNKKIRLRREVTYYNSEKVSHSKTIGCINPIIVDDVYRKCRKCALCQQKRRQEWQFRLLEELKVSDSAHFLTLTYNNQNLPHIKGIPTLVKKHTQDFLKNLRRQQQYFYEKTYKLKPKQAREQAPKIKYYFVGEYGTNTLRPHYHAIIFNIIPEIVEKLGDIWNKGHIQVGTVNEKSIAYTTKYIQKDTPNWKYKSKVSRSHRIKYNPDGTEKQFSNMSKGLGYAYMEDNWQYHYDNETMTVLNRAGYEQLMPETFRKKLFINKEDREKILTQTITKLEQQLQTELKYTKFTDDLILSINDDINRRAKIKSKDKTL